MNTVEVPQITSLADVPTEFWIAASIQILVLIFAIWAVAKFIQLTVKIATRRKPSTSEITPAADTIDDDFADIAAEMKKERDHA